MEQCNFVIYFIVIIPCANMIYSLKEHKLFNSKQNTINKKINMCFYSQMLRMKHHHFTHLATYPQISLILDAPLTNLKTDGRIVARRFNSVWEYSFLKKHPTIQKGRE